MPTNTMLAVAGFTPRSLQPPISWTGHIPFAAWLIQYLHPTLFVELGTHTGNSYFSFCQAVAESNLATKCYAVDTWHGDQHAGQYGDEVFQLVDSFNRSNFSAFSSLLRTTFDDASQQFSSESIDLLHIDGLHTYEAVRHDFETWRPKLAPGAVVLFHDISVREKDFGVWNLWEELKRDFPCHFEFFHSNGLGVLQRDGASPEKSLAWISSDPNVRQFTNEYFAALGENIRKLYAQPAEDKGIIIELHDEISRHKKILSAREEQIEQLKHANAELENHRTERDKQLMEREERLAEHVQQLAQRDHRLIEQDLQLALRLEQLAERDRQLAEQDQKLAGKDQQLTEQQKQLAEQAQLINVLKGEMSLVFASNSWKITEPVRKVTRTLRRLRASVGKTRNIVSARGGLVPFTQKAVKVIRSEGISSIKGRLAREDAKLHLVEMAPAFASRHPAKIKIIPHYLLPSDGLVPDSAPPVSIAVHLHLYYPEMLDTYTSRLAGIRRPFDLYVSVPKKTESSQIRSRLQEGLPHAEKVFVEPVPNRGRDIAPLIVQFGERLCRYQIVAHFHTKKSPHCDQLDRWCQDILDLLLGPENNENGHIEQILALLQSTAKLVYPQGQTQIIKDKSGWGGNYSLAKTVLERHTTLKIEDFPVVEFSEGSMFWARSECLRDFLTLPLHWNDFPPEPIAADGTLAHALERLLLIFASEYPGDFYRLHLGDSIPDYRYYEEQRDYSAEISSDVKVLSYYLPQFHPIPENDLWHGKGFTEWTKVSAANPLFEGHYQQHIPHPDIGYYLLDSPDTLRQQADMMRQAGVYGQVFYHYWFTGKLILQEPAQMLLDHPDIAMPFCFCWANENWTRRWDGNEDEVLMQQQYSAEDARAFIQYLMPFFRDARYLRVQDRPVLFIYRPSSIPAEQNYLQIWADECLAQGLPSPYVVAVLTRGATSPFEFGMDAGVERVMHDWTDGAVGEQKHNLTPYRPLRGSILSYPEVAEFYAAQKQTKPFTWFRSLVPIWDNTARYGEDAYLLHGSTPDLFAGWLKACVAHARQHLPEDRRFVVVNAWNEWAEGAHLEPDSRYGYAYLNSVGRTLAGISPESRLNPQVDIPVGTHVRITFSPGVEAAINADSRIKHRFLQSLARSTFLGKCRVDCDSAGLQHDLSPLTPLVKASKDTPDYLLQIRRPVLFDSHVVEKMLQSAIASRDSTVLSNTYDRHSPLVEALDSGGVDAAFAYAAPIALMPVNPAQGYRNYRIRGDAFSFPLDPDSLRPEVLPRVTTIIRYHKTGTLAQLANALNCLRAMQNCLVVPFIATQDLDDRQQADLQRLLDSIDWPQQTRPHLEHHHSEGGCGDLRAQLLTESLKKAQTRYAAFLDYDDLLMSHAYGYLINRLETTGKAISFGRVYSAHCNTQSGLFFQRRREFVHGRNYADFFACNHAPLHSFLLDLNRLNTSELTYHPDQCYLEDYYLTLQLITDENTDWQSLGENCYIGDYLHNLERSNTLAFADRQQHDAVINSPAYQACVQRITKLKDLIRQKNPA